MKDRKGPPKSSLKRSQMGFPDWRNRSAYPEDIPMGYWKWEFLRRRPDYQQDWEKYSPLTYEKNKATYRNQRSKRITFKFRGKVIHPKKEKILTPNHPEFTAEMPGCSKKYNLALLLNPKNPRPRNLMFPEDPLDPDWVVGEGKLKDFYGLSILLRKKEVAMGFNLSHRPIERQMAELAMRFRLPELLARSLSRPDPNIYDWLCCLTDTDESNQGTKRDEDYYVPKIITTISSREQVIVIFDLAYSFWPQWGEAKQWLSSLQKEKGYKFRSPRLHPKKWGRYLRILDARAAGISNKEIIERIGKEIFSDCKGSDPYISLNRFFKSAEHLQQNFPL